jgi:hypothetical protein
MTWIVSAEVQKYIAMDLTNASGAEGTVEVIKA